jgi:hypothetical protein
MKQSATGIPRRWMDSMSFPPRLERVDLYLVATSSRRKARSLPRDSCRFLHIGQGLIRVLGGPAGATASLAAVFDQLRQSNDWVREEKSVWLMAGQGRDKN